MSWWKSYNPNSAQAQLFLAVNPLHFMEKKFSSRKHERTKTRKSEKINFVLSIFRAFVISFSFLDFGGPGLVIVHTK
jgi:hypothetical protein